MKLFLLPKTTLGKWSVGLAISLIILFAFVSIMGATGQEAGETFFSNLLLAIPGLIALVSGVGAFVTGLVSIIFMRERAILVYIATALGLLLILFILTDFLITED